MASVHAPSSPFAELLRRSRFATFDPNIRQTYSTPPAYAHRGNWGLKRPLALRRRNAFISLPAPFEDRAQYIEWNKAESEVRFIKRFEEMEVMPYLRPNTPWYVTVGNKNLGEWLLDSEFCHEHEGPQIEEMVEENALNEVALDEEKAKKDMQQSTLTPDLREFGQKGTGGYGARRALNYGNKRASHLTPNIDAMTPRQFERYVSRLRELRPKFKEYLQNIAADAAEKNVEDGKNRPLAQLAQKSLFTIAQGPTIQHYSDFLEAHTADQFADVESGVIEQRPHRIGALLYHHPSPLHTQLFARPQPGILLQAAEYKKPGGAIHSVHPMTVLISSFGGMTTVVDIHDRGDKLPLFEPHSEAGMKRERLASSIANMRMLPYEVILLRPPLSVGVNASGLNHTEIISQATVLGARPIFSKTNPFPPGSMDYVALEDGRSKIDALRRPTASREFVIKAKLAANAKKDKPAMAAHNKTLLDSLKQTLTKKSAEGKEEEEKVDKWLI